MAALLFDGYTESRQRTRQSVRARKSESRRTAGLCLHEVKVMRFYLYILLSALCLALPALAQEPAPKKTDSKFVSDTGGDLDTTKPAGSRLSFTIKIDRVVGETDNDGKLLNVQQLIDNGVVSEFVTLELSAFDIDSDFAENPECTPRERDRIMINGENISGNSTEVFLTGTTDKWKKFTYKIPARLIRFGKWTCDQGNCSWQGEGENNIDIDVSTAAPQPFQCFPLGGPTITVNWKAKVDWGAISFKALYPVILIHGYSSSGEFWADSDHKFIQSLDQQKILYDKSINFPNKGKNAVFVDNARLNTEIERIASQQYHVKHVHLVAHSKGGLTARDYLSTGKQSPAVLSLTTLSTMHKGTAQADFSLDVNEVGISGAFSTGQGLGQDIALALATIFAPEDAALVDMRVTYVRDEFNPSNVRRLPSKMTVDDEDTNVRYYSFGADANIDRSPFPAPGSPTISSLEAAGSPFVKRLIVGPLFGRRAAEAAYRLLFDLFRTEVEYKEQNGKNIPYRVQLIKGGDVNDFFVTVNSTILTEKFESQSPEERLNHQRIAKPEVADKVIAKIKSANP